MIYQIIKQMRIMDKNVVFKSIDGEVEESDQGSYLGVSGAFLLRSQDFSEIACLLLTCHRTLSDCLLSLGMMG